MQPINPNQLAVTPLKFTYSLSVSQCGFSKVVAHCLMLHAVIFIVYYTSLLLLLSNQSFLNKKQKNLELSLKSQEHPPPSFLKSGFEIYMKKINVSFSIETKWILNLNMILIRLFFYLKLKTRLCSLHYS